MAALTIHNFTVSHARTYAYTNSHTLTHTHTHTHTHMHRENQVLQQHLCYTVVCVADVCSLKLVSGTKTNKSPPATVGERY